MLSCQAKLIQTVFYVLFSTSLRDEDRIILDESERPSHLYEVLIQSLTEELNWVLDAGSLTGTGLLASLSLGRNAVLLTEKDSNFPYIRQRALHKKKGETSGKSANLNMHKQDNPAEDELSSEASHAEIEESNESARGREIDVHI